MARRDRRHPGPVTLAEVAVRTVGWRRAPAAISWVISWGVYREVVGHEDFRVDDVGEWWAMSRSQAFREQATFREAYSYLGATTPAHFIDMEGNEQLAERIKLLATRLLEVEAAHREDSVGEAVVELGWAAAT